MAAIKEYSLDNAQIVIIGNKSDLQDERKISKDEGIKMAKCYEAKFMETSVINDRNILKTLNRMATNICERF